MTSQFSAKMFYSKMRMKFGKIINSILLSIQYSCLSLNSDTSTNKYVNILHYLPNNILHNMEDTVVLKALSCYVSQDHIDDQLSEGNDSNDEGLPRTDCLIEAVKDDMQHVSFLSSKTGFYDLLDVLMIHSEMLLN